MNKKLYVGNLPYEMTDDQLRDLFAQAGTVISAQVIRFQDTGRSKGFAFVEFDTEEDAQKAIDMFNNNEESGRKMIVNEARPPQPRTGGGGFGGGNRGGGGGGRYNRGGGGGGRRDFRGGDRGGDRGDRGGDDFGGGNSY